MSLETLKSRLPDYAKDLKLNLSSLAAEVSLTEQQRAGTFVASALAARNAEVTAALLRSLSAFPRLSELYLWYTPVNDDSLAAISSLKGALGLRTITCWSVRRLESARKARAISSPAVWIRERSMRMLLP